MSALHSAVNEPFLLVSGKYLQAILGDSEQIESTI
jgi:hypothetical protein